MSTPAAAVEAATLTLRVQAACYLAEGVLGLTLVHPLGEPLPAWAPGAHLSVTLPSGAVRAYSLCGDPAQRSHYLIAVQHEPEGRGGSREIHQQQLVGRCLAVTAPVNVFALCEAAHYLFIAGGIGITPLLPMLMQVASSPATWEIHYIGRTRPRMAFCEELQRLGKHPRGRINLVPRDHQARPDLAALLADLPSHSAIYACGPPGLLSELEPLCRRLQPHAQLVVERFGRPLLADLQPPHEPPLASAEDDPGLSPCDPQGGFEVQLGRDGECVWVAPGQSILEALRPLRSGLSFSCADGYCGTCETRVLQGQPDHRDSVLNDAEKQRNQSMMICVSRACSARLVLDI